MQEKIEELFDIVEELCARETSNNCIRFLDKGYVELCDTAIQILQELKD